VSSYESTVPRRADARRNRSLILAAAEEAFAKEGLGVPVDEIARRAGVGAGTLYRHFPTKEALFEAVLVDHMERLAEAARALVESDEPGPALFTLIGRLAAEGSSKRNLIDALSGAGVDLHESEQKAEFERAVAELLERAQSAGQVRPDVTVKDLFGLVMGACALAPMEDDGYSPSRMLAVVCDGLRTGSVRSSRTEG
jgi:AcrR family transcriptional regulator